MTMVMKMAMTWSSSQPVCALQIKQKGAEGGGRDSKTGGDEEWNRIEMQRTREKAGEESRVTEG